MPHEIAAVVGEGCLYRAGALRPSAIRGSVSDDLADEERTREGGAK